MNRLTSCIILFIMLTPVVTAGGSSGLTFLKLETNPRSAAMGGTGTAHFHESSLMHYNPAGIADMPYSDLQLVHTSWIQEMSMQYGSGVLSLGRSSLGIALYNSSIEGIEIRNRPGPPEGEFTARNFGAGATFAYRISPSFRAGITGKILYEKIYVDEATGYAVDLGVQYRSTTPGLLFGFSVLNIGSMGDLRNEPSTLPMTYRIGSSYEIPFTMHDFTIRLAVDALNYSGDDKLHLMFGGEFGYTETIFARIGLQSGVEARGFTAGIGIHYGAFKIDYAYLPLNDNLGTGHIIGIGILF
jgi:hypothetical protein